MCILCSFTDATAKLYSQQNRPSTQVTGAVRTLSLEKTPRITGEARRIIKYDAIEAFPERFGDYYFRWLGGDTEALFSAALADSLFYKKLKMVLQNPDPFHQNRDYCCGRRENKPSLHLNPRVLVAMIHFPTSMCSLHRRLDGNPRTLSLPLKTSRISPRT